MLLSRTSEYAIRALVYILVQNRAGRRPGFKEIANKTDAPEQFLAKILQTLAKKGMISSVKGRGGGFFFEDPDEILSLYEVIVLLEDKGFFSDCLLGLKSCNEQRPCPLHVEINVLRNQIINLVKKLTIQELSERIVDRKAVLSRLLAD